MSRSASNASHRTLLSLTTSRVATGKFLKFEPADEAGCFVKYFFWPSTCPCLGPAVMESKWESDTSQMGTNATLCGGMVPMSPCPCCIYCGFGPCGAEWKFNKVCGAARPHSDREHSTDCLPLSLSSTDLPYDVRAWQDPANPTKWLATGSVFAGNCCEACTNHKGDEFVIDAEHVGTPEKPLKMFATGPHAQ